MKIRVIVTGGTIAKKYDEISGKLTFDKEHLKKMLLQARSQADIITTNLMLKDSLDMNDKDRTELYNTCKETKENKILITHGTDTMTKSAKKLSSIKNKTIVLTGAMIPYAFKNSDALFNLGSALSAIQTLPFGVYICMNGKVFSWDRVKKDKKRGVFEAIS